MTTFSMTIQENPNAGIIMRQAKLLYRRRHKYKYNIHKAARVASAVAKPSHWSCTPFKQ